MAQAHAFTNKEFTVLPSANRDEGASGGSNTSVEFTNKANKGVILILDITAVGGTSPTLDVKLQGKDPASGKWFDVVGGVFSQQNSTGTNHITIYPGIAETANSEISEVLPKTWRVSYTIGGTGTPNITFSVGAITIG